MDLITQTVNELGAVMLRSVDCRRSLATLGSDGALLPDTLALLDDLDEHAFTLVTRVRTVARGSWAEPAATVLH